MDKPIPRRPKNLLVLDIDKIKKHMQKRGWDEWELSLRMRVFPQWTLKILEGKSHHTLVTVSRVAEALELDPKEILKIEKAA